MAKSKKSRKKPSFAELERQVSLALKASEKSAGKKEDRLLSGIKGLDGLLNGGIPGKTLTIVAGSCGTGKSILGLQFLYQGASQGEAGLLISLEDEPSDIQERVKSFDWTWSDLVKSKKLFVSKPDAYDFKVLKELIEDHVERFNVKRVVIDPFSLITAYFEKVYDARKALSELQRDLRRWGCTAIVVMDVKEGEQTYSSTGYEEFVADGVISMGVVLHTETGAFVRTILVRKMYGIPHSLRLTPFEIGKEGLVVHFGAEVF